MRFAAAFLLAFFVFLSARRAQVPVYEVTPVESSIAFGVESSVPIKGTFEKWDAKMTFTSTDVRSGVLEITIQADSVNTGSGMKNNKLKGKDFFDTKQSPMITFKSTKVMQTGANTFDLEGDFTIRGVTKTEKVTVTDNGKGTTSGSITGTMAFEDSAISTNLAQRLAAASSPSFELGFAPQPRAELMRADACDIGLGVFSFAPAAVQCGILGHIQRKT